MKKCKYFILMTLIVLLTGCSNEYTLTIKNGQIYEEIITKNKKIKDPDICNDIYIECDNDSYEILDYNYFPFKDNYDEEYKIENESTDDEIISKRTYTFTYENYENSNALNSCFETINYDNSTFKISLSANDLSNCFEGDTLIKIKTGYTVLSNNADKQDGNTLIWEINELNYKTKSIEIELLKFSISKIVLYVILIVVILLFFYFFKNKFKKVNEIN